MTLVSRFQDKILACDNLEAIVEFLKIDLPRLAVDEQESIVNDALAMDFGDKLLRFEVEYQIFEEDEVNPELVKPLIEKNEKLAEQNINLKHRVDCLEKELKQIEKDFLDEISELKIENMRLRSLVNVEESPPLSDSGDRRTNDGLVNGDDGGGSGDISPGYVELTGHSFEISAGDITGDSGVVYGDSGAGYSPGEPIKNSCTSPTDDNTDSFEHILGETDDEIDTLSCDSPLTIEDSLYDQSISPESEHNSTKL